VLLPLALLIALEASTDPLTWLINYGIAGVVILLLVTGKLRTSAEVDNLKQALVQAREDLASRDKALHDLTVQITNNTLPSMNALADVIEAQPVRADNNQLAAVLTRMDEVLGKIDALEKGRS
jgi:citrate synthase